MNVDVKAAFRTAARIVGFGVAMRIAIIQGDDPRYFMQHYGIPDALAGMACDAISVSLIWHYWGRAISETRNHWEEDKATLREAFADAKAGFPRFRSELKKSLKLRRHHEARPR